jgi:hypothetical protein
LAAADPTVPLHTFFNPNPTAPDPFTSVETFDYGSSIALSGDWLAVGGRDPAYLYGLSAADPEASVVPIRNIGGATPGELEFEFTVPEDTAFFELEAE